MGRDKPQPFGARTQIGVTCPCPIQRKRVGVGACPCPLPLRGLQIAARPVQTLIDNAVLILPDRLIEGGWLLIEDGRILDLGEETTCPTTLAVQSMPACSNSCQV